MAWSRAVSVSSAMDGAGATCCLPRRLQRECMTGGSTGACWSTVIYVATTVVLVPLAMGLGRLVDVDPRGLALLVAVCAQNSFVLPTHQVNALLMAPAGYRNRDYLRVGSLMTLAFLAIAVTGVYVLFVA